MDEEDDFCGHCGQNGEWLKPGEECPYCREEDEGDSWGAEVREAW